MVVTSRCFISMRVTILTTKLLIPLIASYIHFYQPIAVIKTASSISIHACYIMIYIKCHNHNITMIFTYIHATVFCKC